LTVRHGAGAVVSSRRSCAINKDELRKPLGTALTQLALAGLSKREIVGIVMQELESLRQKGGSP
jgi:hypothetical protein